MEPCRHIWRKTWLNTSYLHFRFQQKAKSRQEGYKVFLFLNLTCSQIWLHLVVYDFVTTNYITKLGWKNKPMFKGNVPWSSPKTKWTPNCLELTPHEHSSQCGTTIIFGFLTKKVAIWGIHAHTNSLTHLTKFWRFSPNEILIIWNTSQFSGWFCHLCWPAVIEFWPGYQAEY
jgi:hypothetical protein